MSWPHSRLFVSLLYGASGSSNALLVRERTGVSMHYHYNNEIVWLFSTSGED